MLRLPNSAAVGNKVTMPTSPAAARKTNTLGWSAKLPVAMMKAADKLRWPVPSARTCLVSVLGPPSKYPAAIEMVMNSSVAIIAPVPKRSITLLMLSPSISTSSSAI